MSYIEQHENNIDINELSLMRDSIETMPKFNQIEILRILNSYKNVTLNENKYGIHINLTELDSKIIENLKVYMNYVNTQEINLNNMEKEKEDCLNIYFAKSNKDNLGNYINATASTTASTTTTES